VQYTCNDFNPNDAWLIFRVDSFIHVQDKPVEIYFMIDCATSYAFGQLIVSNDLPNEIDVHRLMKDAYGLKKAWPKIFFCPSNDPGEEFFRKCVEGKNISFQVEPITAFNKIIGPLQKSFRQFQRSDEYEESYASEEAEEAAQSFIPDSYDPCSCASGKKFKFCCKPAFNEIVNAMVEAEDGHCKDAVMWMEKAKNKIGETAEILCRYAIVYSFFDADKSNEYLDRCIEISPHHPRANYIKGIQLKGNGDYNGAVQAYKRAIDNYPSTDRFHLNEVWNNLGSVYWEMKKFAEAKAAWEKALAYLPRDIMARNNLRTMIYENPDVPEAIKSELSMFLFDPPETEH
jgi:tetratricopeptide (TPR) repeat protein